MVATRYGIVAASQPLAARAGCRSSSAAATPSTPPSPPTRRIGLMEPTGNGIGGDLFAIVYEAKTGKLYGLNASGWAPTGLTPELLRARGAARTPTAKEARRASPRCRSAASTASPCPGAVAGLGRAAHALRRLPFKDLLAPAIFYAEEGFPLREVTAAGGAVGRCACSRAHPNATQDVPPGRHARQRAGEVFRNPDLAASLRRIAAAGGRDGFYKGRRPTAIVKALRDGRRHDDRRRSRGVPARVGDPIQTTYRGWTVCRDPAATGRASRR